jgi:hypothetical protein
MNDGQVKKILDSPQECDFEQDSVRSMVWDFYNKKNRLTIIWVWGNSLVFLALTVVSGILFFNAHQTKYQIMYAAIFICSIQVIILAKIVYWQTMHRNRITKELKRLELRIADLNETVKGK